MRKIHVCLLLLFYSLVLSQNLYQTCSNVLESNSIVLFTPYFFDLGNASLPHDQAYTTTLPSGATVHFNLCAGTSLCDGQIACVVQNGRVLSFASPVYSGDYGAYTYPNFNVHMIFYDVGENRMYLNVTCDYNLPPPYFKVQNASFTPGLLTINASSLYACPDDPYIRRYIPPTYYSSFTAPIYMKGRIPFFLQDVLTSSSTEFLGTLYYSTQYGLAINGTLTNTTTGESHFVAYYFVMQMPFNPPTLYNYVIQPGATAACYNLGNPNHIYAQDIFSEDVNTFMALYDRVYTPIYFNKGSSFAVRTYTSYSNAYYNVVSVQQRESDGLPVFLGTPLLSPWVDGLSVGTYVSELDWTNIQSTTLGANTFQPPAALGCQLE